MTAATKNPPTNTEILNLPGMVLTEIQRQTHFLLRVALAPSPCPACGLAVSQVDAYGKGLDGFDAGSLHFPEESPGKCPGCDAELVLIVPFLGPWFWRLSRRYQEAHLTPAQKAHRESVDCARKGIPFAALENDTLWLYRFRRDQVEPVSRESLPRSGHYVWRVRRAQDGAPTAGAYTPLPDGRLDDWLDFARSLPALA